MKAPVRLGLYGLILVAVFAVAGFTANAVIPEETVQSWVQDTDDNTHHEEGDDMDTAGHDGHTAGAASLGLGIAQDGYQLTAVSAPTETGTEGELSLTVTGPDGSAVTDFEPEHEKELHLIAVRADGQHFQHVHPEMTDNGTWTIPWQWAAAGTYRVFADFVPEDTGEGLTLSTSVQVAGDFDPEPTEPATTTTVDGFDVTVEGDLVAGSASELTMTVTRDGEPVTDLEPYLGAFGHLVALRDGDLAYLHVHPDGEPGDGKTRPGPTITFYAEVPSSGAYRLYPDFKHGDKVRTAEFTVHAGNAALPADEPAGPREGGEPDDGHGHTH